MKKKGGRVEKKDGVKKKGFKGEKKRLPFFNALCLAQCLFVYHKLLRPSKQTTTETG